MQGGTEQERYGKRTFYDSSYFKKTTTKDKKEEYWQDKLAMNKIKSNNKGHMVDCYKLSPHHREVSDDDN